MARFLVDECTGPGVASWLATQGHDVISIYDEAPGVDDDVVLEMAVAQNRVLVTDDKDFGEMIFRESKAHCGVVLLRLNDQRLASRIAVLSELLERHSERLAGNFAVASPTGFRIVDLT